MTGCRASQPEPPPDRESCLPDSWRPRLDVPAHLDPSFDPDTGLWAWAERFGPLFPAAEGQAFSTDDVRALDEPFESYELSVLDPGEGPDARRRVYSLCDEGDVRIGFWQAAQDLRATNHSPALLVAASSIPQWGERTPGVRLPAGVAEVERDEGASSLRASYDDGWLRAEGWISAALVDVVSGRETTKREPGLVDGVLVAPQVVFHDAPDGDAFAWLDVSRSAATWVRVLDERTGFVLVDLVLLDANPGLRPDVEVVGWIADEAFEARPTQLAPTRVEKGGGGGHHRHGPDTTKLEVGTLLVHEASQSVVGVVTEATDFWCEGPCEEPAPRVTLHACEHEFDLRALRPSSSARLCRESATTGNTKTESPRRAGSR